ncbi:STP1 protein [Plasmodium malariae]|uniref:STP1 protein n=1 Tax=Plasmodium malariae TaxID=5858 RepID=A0A1A8WUV6_PLAMA|nr:STP1 protein [Plasmodium malariae]
MEWGTLGSSALRLYATQEFGKISKHIKNKIPSLINETNKDTFRSECLELIDFLIKNKSAPYYVDQSRWEATVKHWATSHYKQITKKHGGCFPILDYKEKEILELNYEALNFCDEKNNRINGIQCPIRGHRISGECDETCSSKIDEYNVWIDQRQKYFRDKKLLIKNSCKNISQHFPNRPCNIFNSTTFKKHPKCTPSPSVSPGQHKPEEAKKLSQEVNKNTSDILQNPEIPKEQVISIPQGEETKHDQEIQLVHNSHSPVLLSTQPVGTTDKSTKIQDMPPDQDANPKTATQLENKESLSPVSNIRQSPDSQESLVIHSFKTSSLTAEVLRPSSTISNVNKHPKVLGTIIKKKKISRKRLKFLRLLVPSFSKNKSKFLSDDHLEHPIYDEKEIVKKIKINEFKKNVNLSYRKKDRSKTIIEVHMEVLKYCKNEEWENKKKEFLEICIDEFTKKEHNAYSNLSDDYLTTDNINSSNDVTKQNIIWNKWIERYRNISEILKKENWFNNLKNEWKKENAYIQDMQKLKKKASNENHYVPFLEIEKDLWKLWISKKGIIIVQYLEQDSFKKLGEYFDSMSDEYLNEDNKNYVSLNNIEELQHTENYEVLYKYIKTKLLTKLCILVLMSMLEECKKEMNFESTESYLDSSINESKMEEYSDKKQEIIENTIEYNSNNLENTQNEKFYTHIENDSFMNEIMDWIREDDVYSNSIVYDGTVEKSDEIAEKQFL